ncbi:MAG TPA: hypothetical protein ENF19_00650, partial [Candidatus Bathyarchaeota archaeon]|nr:hypothetical protein [Candidatus Bathyarchaeota archaeon]
MERPESILIKNGLLLTMQGEGVGSIPDGAVAIQDGEIVAVGKTHRVEPQHRDAEVVIDAQGKAVLPGFVDGHIHTGLSILRGLAQDVPEIEWMLKTLAPFTPHIEARHQVAGSRLGVLEALKAGTTTFGEIGGNMAPLVEQVFLPMGVRANVANTINQIGPDSRPDPHKPYVFYEDVGEEKLRRALELVDRFDGADGGRITVIFAPHGADMMDTSLLLRVREEALSRGKLIHIHVAQGGEGGDTDAAEVREDHRPIPGRVGVPGRPPHRRPLPPNHRPGSPATRQERRPIRQLPRQHSRNRRHNPTPRPIPGQRRP